MCSAVFKWTIYSYSISSYVLLNVYSKMLTDHMHSSVSTMDPCHWCLHHGCVGLVSATGPSVEIFENWQKSMLQLVAIGACIPAELYPQLVCFDSILLNYI